MADRHVNGISIRTRIFNSRCFTVLLLFSLKESALDSTENSAGYELYSVVSNIKDNVDGNTLVAAIHVSESYHERKEVSSLRNNIPRREALFCNVSTNELL